MFEDLELKAYRELYHYLNQNQDAEFLQDSVNLAEEPALRNILTYHEIKAYRELFLSKASKKFESKNRVDNLSHLT